MKRDVVAQLLALRRMHEKRAFEQLAVSESARAAARKDAEAAREASRQHEEEASARDGQMLSGISGKAVSQATLSRLLAEREDMRLESADLRAAIQSADDGLRRREEEVAEAQRAAQLRQKAVLKLESFAKKRDRQARRLAELAED